MATPITLRDRGVTFDLAGQSDAEFIRARAAYLAFITRIASARRTLAWLVV